MIIHNDALIALKDIEDESIDLIVTDPPYGIEFMGKDWDKALPSQEIWQQCFRVLKTGKLAFIMCSPRQDVPSRMILSLDMAGFKTGYSSIYWSYASGFPKAKNNKDGSYVGFQPKPAVEVILVVSKGKTLTWLDDCRIPYQSENEFYKYNNNNKFGYRQYCQDKGYDHIVNGKTTSPLESNQKGRFPANLLVSDDVLNDGKITKSEGGNQLKRKNAIFGNTETQTCCPSGYGDSGSYSRYFDLDKWYSTFPFIITPKASKSERNEGCEDLEPQYQYEINKWSENDYRKGNGEKTTQPKQNFHPTVKPIKLMSYLITLGSRENDLVLDPFCGSGTTCIAAHMAHRKWIGIEINGDYMEIIKERLKAETKQLFLEAFI